MRRTLSFLFSFMIAALIAPLFAGPASAAALRIANTGDVVMLDPQGRHDLFMTGFLTNIYEPLIGQKKTPVLATEWTQTSPEVWRFKLRQNVKFQDGSPFTADDVIFTYKRVQTPNSQMKGTVSRVKEIKKVDDYTIDLVTDGPDSILPQELTEFLIMSEAWAKKNDAMEPSNFAGGQENFATRHANGTGPFMVTDRKPGVSTTLAPSPNWWGKPEHNLTEVVFTPIANPVTQVAALLSGNIDLLVSVPTQDVERLRKSQGIKVMERPGYNTIYLGLDQFRDELPSSNIKGKNPFKDVRVRKAIYQAIDEEAIKTKVMRGSAAPTAVLFSPEFTGYDASIAKRAPYDANAAKKLLADAGYPNGFTVGMDCPNDRYVNDEAICQAVVSMLARVGIKVNLLAQTRGTYFSKILPPKRDTDFFMMMWSGTSGDAYENMANLILSYDKGGEFNIGGYSNPKVDELLKASRTENDPKKRAAELTEAMKIHEDDFGSIPLHQQTVVWAMRSNVEAVQQPDGNFLLREIKLK